MECVWALFSCRAEALTEVLVSGALMVYELVKKGESGSALALLEVHHYHPISTSRCRLEFGRDVFRITQAHRGRRGGW